MTQVFAMLRPNGSVFSSPKSCQTLSGALHGDREEKASACQLGSMVLPLPHDDGKEKASGVSQLSVSLEKKVQWKT